MKSRLRIDALDVEREKANFVGYRQVNDNDVLIRRGTKVHAQQL